MAKITLEIARSLGVSQENLKIMLTLSEIEVKVNELAQKIGAPQNILPTYGYSEQTARPHVEVSPQAYYYVVAQSGQEVSRYATHDIDQLLYKIFVDVTFGLAITHAEKNRIENQDIRRSAFPHQIELFTRLSPQWGERMSQEQVQILEQAPFDDDGSLRAAYGKSLRDQGYSVAQANKMAHEKFPYPNQPKGVRKKQIQEHAIMKSSTRIYIGFIVSFLLGISISLLNGRSLASAFQGGFFFGVLVGIIVAMLSWGIDIAVKKGYPAWVGFFLILSLNVFGLLILAVLPNRTTHIDTK